jgi:choline kinase
MSKAVRNIVPTRRPKNITTQGLTVIIPAAGSGKRMKCCGVRSLCISKQCAKTLIEKQIENILSIYPSAEILIATGFQHERIRNVIYQKYPVRLIYNPIFEDTNVLYSISLCLNATLNDKILIIYGDLYFGTNAISIPLTESCVVLNKGQNHREEICATIDGDKICNFTYGKYNKWSQITYLTGRELQLFTQFAFHSDNAKLLGHEALNHIINKGGIIRPFFPDGSKIIEIDTPSDIERL